jgi:hypothetical protein
LIAKYTPAAIDLQPGDTFAEVTGGWQQMRGATLVATFLRKDMTRTELTAPQLLNSWTLPFAFYVEEHPMAAIATTMTNVTLEGTTYNFQFGPEGFPKTLEDLEAERVELQSVAMAQKIARVNAYAKSNGGADMTGMVGIPVTIDFDANNPIQIGD